MPCLSRLRERNPAICHAIGDLEFLREKLACFLERNTLSLALDRSLDQAEQRNGISVSLKNEIERTYEAFARTSQQIETRLPGIVTAPSDRPLPELNVRQIVPPAGNCAVAKVRETIYTLKLFGVDIAGIPGLEPLKELAPDPDLEVAESEFGRLRAYLRENDIEAITLAMLAGGGGALEAKKMLQRKKEMEEMET
jgi:hypothetical protein